MVSYAHARTPRGRMLAQFKGVTVSKHQVGMELKLVDVGMEGVFSWKDWQGTRQSDKGGSDSATLVFKSADARDALLYSLWKAADQSFQTGWGAHVLDLRLSLQSLQELAGPWRPKYLLSYMTHQGEEIHHTHVAEFANVLHLPDAANQVFQEHKAAEGFVAVCVLIEFAEPFQAKLRGRAMFTPSVRHACGQDEKPCDPTLHDFYFDFANEKLLLEELIVQYMRILAAGYNDNTDVRPAHVALRQLTVMHDICQYGRAVQEQEMAEEYPELS